jgi:DNA-binding HxlR family transcriptional regulator
VSKPKRSPRASAAAAQAASDELRSSCPIAGALDLLGDRWTLLVLRDVLLFDRHLFGELQASPEQISTNTLTERLRRLELSGLIERRIYQSNPERCSYHATDKARDLVPVLRELVLWSARHVPGVSRPTPAQLRLFAAAARRS